ncbi:MAG: alanine racemase [Gammaproteobacteria bacterium]
MTRAAEALIDLQAIRHNLQRVRETAPTSKVIAIIKANGYGHGMARVASALQSVDAFGVSSLYEALKLREEGVQHPILLLEGIYEQAELVPVCQHNLSLVIHSHFQIEILENSGFTVPLNVWLKVDTGMHRLGFNISELDSVYHRLQACPQVAEPVRVMSHLANADDKQDPKTIEQIKIFKNAIKNIDSEFSIANSAAILGWPESHLQWVRPGLMLFGISPFCDRISRDDALIPVMTFRSKLIAINYLKKGDKVGYGGTWECPEDMPVGTVAAGYGDGYPRAAKSGTPVLINGQRVPLIGRVSMDMIIVDLRQVPKAGIGDDVVLWGGDLPVEEVARCASTIPYELLCGIKRRVRFIET